MPRRRALPRQRSLRLGELEVKFFKFFDPPRRSTRPKSSYSSSFVFSSINSRIRYFFVWTSNGRYLGIKLD